MDKRTRLIKVVGAATTSLALVTSGVTAASMSPLASAEESSQSVSINTKVYRVGGRLGLKIDGAVTGQSATFKIGRKDSSTFTDIPVKEDGVEQETYWAQDPDNPDTYYIQNAATETGEYTLKVTPQGGSEVDLDVTAYPQLAINSIQPTTVEVGGSLDVAVTGVAETATIELVQGTTSVKVLGTKLSPSDGKFTVQIPEDTPAGTYKLRVRDEKDTNGSTYRVVSTDDITVLSHLTLSAVGDTQVAAGKTATVAVTGLSANEGLKFTLAPKASGTAREVKGTAVEGQSGTYTVNIPSDLSTGGYTLAATTDSRKSTSNVDLTVYGKLGVSVDSTTVNAG
ncbi:MAG: hypothetical protein Q3962_07975, partial [Corynebacterium sp.]|nr:hypothetical protein [Corynebacterium sp.]